MNATFTDYYAVLGIRADADLNAIKSAYRCLAMRYPIGLVALFLVMAIIPLRMGR
jgi:preprotein translocase subunit Sec63